MTTRLRTSLLLPLFIQAMYAFEQASNLQFTQQTFAVESYFSAIFSQGSIGMSASVSMTEIAIDGKIKVSGTAGQTQWFYFDLVKYEGNDIPLVQIELSGGTGNAEIYATFAELPTEWDTSIQNVASCTSDDVDIDNEETCHILYEVGRFYVLVYGESDFANADLQWSLVSVPWTYRRMCEEVVYRVESTDVNEINFMYYLDEWKLSHLSGMDIVAWNDGHSLSVLDPEVKCAIENYDAHVTGEVSRCSYNSTAVANGELESGYYYVQVMPGRLVPGPLDSQVVYEVNVLLRFYYAISWRIYWKEFVVLQTVVRRELIVLYQWEFVHFPYACIGHRCWFFTACVWTLDGETPAPTLPNVGPGPLPPVVGVPPAFVVPPVGGVGPVPPPNGGRQRRRRRRRQRRRRALSKNAAAVTDGKQAEEEDVGLSVRDTKRNRQRRRRLRGGGGGWNKGSDGGSNWGSNKNWGNDNSNWNTNTNSNWNSNSNKNWNSKPSSDSSDSKSCNKKVPSRPPVRPTPPPVRPTPPPLRPTPPPVPKPTPPPDFVVIPTEFPTPPPIPPQRVCNLYVTMWDDHDKEWEVFEQDDNPFVVLDANLNLLEIEFTQCVGHCTATRFLSIIYVYTNFRGWWVKFDTLSGQYVENTYPNIDLAPLTISDVQNPCIVQDDDDTIYAIGGRGRNAPLDAQTYMQVWKWSINSWNVGIRHPVDSLHSMSCAYRNGQIYTFGGLVRGALGVDRPYEGVWAYDVTRAQWTDMVTTLPFPNWGMRVMLDETDGYFYMIGGFAYSDSNVASATTTAFETNMGGITAVFDDVVIDSSLTWNASLVQVFDYKSNYTKFESGFFKFGLDIVDDLVGNQVGGFLAGFWMEYRSLMTRVVTTYIEMRKIVWSVNMTFIANTTDVTDCLTPFPTPSPTTPPPSTTTRPPTTSRRPTTSTTPAVWDNANKGKNANSIRMIEDGEGGEDEQQQNAAAAAAHPVEDDDDDEDSGYGAAADNGPVVGRYRRGYDTETISKPATEGGVSAAVAMNPKVRNWMVYGGMFGILLFIVLLKLVCDNHEYRRQLQHNYLYGLSKHKMHSLDDDEDDDTEEERPDDLDNKRSLNEADVDADDDDEQHMNL